ncbi:hypothetical protein HPP92_000435 [Vanilla planifolia]|uniref:Uncharacterized protein n=1 Tax=Vanilla planifolia TaxID=51239 RepID=A0A835VKK2_VANPL|nr:hypothetical protein HPP92_000435 [Vanilla planifolia]
MVRTVESNGWVIRSFSVKPVRVCHSSLSQFDPQNQVSHAIFQVEIASWSNAVGPEEGSAGALHSDVPMVPLIILIKAQWQTLEFGFRTGGVSDREIFTGSSLGLLHSIYFCQFVHWAGEFDTEICDKLIFFQFPVVIHIETTICFFSQAGCSTLGYWVTVVHTYNSFADLPLILGEQGLVPMMGRHGGLSMQDVWMQSVSCQTFWGLYTASIHFYLGLHPLLPPARLQLQEENSDRGLNTLSGCSFSQDGVVRIALPGSMVLGSWCFNFNSLRFLGSVSLAESVMVSSETRFWVSWQGVVKMAQSDFDQKQNFVMAVVATFHRCRRLRGGHDQAGSTDKVMRWKVDCDVIIYNILDSAKAAADLARDFSLDVEYKFGDLGLDDIIKDDSIQAVAIVLAGQVQVRVGWVDVSTYIGAGQCGSVLMRVKPRSGSMRVRASQLVSLVLMRVDSCRKGSMLVGVGQRCRLMSERVDVVEACQHKLIDQLENGCAGVFVMAVSSPSPKIYWRVDGTKGTLQIERGVENGRHGYTGLTLKFLAGSVCHSGWPMSKNFPFIQWSA